MKLEYLDFPEYSEKYPDKSLEDWEKYKGPYLYKEMKENIEKHINELTKEELEELEQQLKELGESYGISI
ncbi:hypothetical protein A5881_002969 [Enterococcus termitis]|nr:hypothetical protein A5881_002374 [Enterococcus termitis]